MEKEDYKFEVTNLKISVKLPREVSLKFVEDRCKLLYPIHKDIICKLSTPNILTIRYRDFTYILFKRSSEKNHQGIIPLQHCNITKISSESEIPEAIGYLFVIINQPPIWLNYTIDNYSCLANTNQLIDIVGLYMNEPKIRCDYNEEKFPGLKIYSPKEISERNLTSLLFKSGSVILVGGNNLNEVNEFFNWVLKITRKYPKL
jgi:TATA-box binding protein (TBP) (component of TFIID and TFIIIB)